MTAELGGLQRAIWEGSIPLEIRLAGAECRTFDDSDPYMIQYPRLTYLPFLLPRLHAFFASALIDPSSAPSDGWFECDGVPLKWHYPVGLLYDLYAGAEPFSQEAGDKNQDGLPWRLVVHFSDWPDESLVKPDAEGKTVHDAFVNSVKEADFLRNGTAKAVMSLSKEDSTNLWQSVESRKWTRFRRVRHANARRQTASRSSTASTRSCSAITVRRCATYP
ncbi:autophagy protein Apg5-domain-containing protein [Lineolata rhizophorae]|uniref:Autophagy protein Apg5-domain-containing protein n=1 Tax=Lineolata rhizophorae TaxID=578093 RepID=A0A6A6NU69_9PEZI|nr:autophagy protein Apg5-domain-containing protein [Lineolata rhizophorae]